MKTFQGKTLVGSYEIDEEGVRVAPLPVIKDGMLVDYLLGREPIRDFGDSNGHGRAAPGQAPSPSIGIPDAAGEGNEFARRAEEETD